MCQFILNYEDKNKQNIAISFYLSYTQDQQETFGGDCLDILWYVLEETIQKYSSFFEATAYMLDRNGTVVISSDGSLLGSKLFRSHPHANLNRVIEGGAKELGVAQDFLYCVSVMQNDMFYCYIAAKSEKVAAVSLCCQTAAIAVGELLVANPDRPLPDILKVSEGSRHSMLVDSLLAQPYNHQKTLALFQTAELDGTLLRSIICIEMVFQTNQYFNINLNLGYQPIIEDARSKIISIVEANKYFNTQDICAYRGENKIVIVKSFINNHDISKVYLALDKICESLCEELSGAYLLDFKIAYGNLYNTISKLRCSYEEAKEIISIGKIEYPDKNFYNVDSIITDIICRFLHPHVVNKVFIPLIKRLTNSEGVLEHNLLESCEAFIDSCMNLNRAAHDIMVHRNTLNNRIAKLNSLTGLDPANSFQDALILKLLIVYLRQQNNLTITEP